MPTIPTDVKIRTGGTTTPHTLTTPASLAPYTLLAATAATNDLAALPQAAAQGNPDAQCHLGALYIKGEDVPQDLTAAREWFGKACDNGLQKGCDACRLLDKAMR